MALSIFTMLCSHHHFLVPELFPHPQRNSVSSHFPFLTMPHPLATTNLLSFLFAYSRYFLLMEWYNIWPLALGTLFGLSAYFY